MKNTIAILMAAGLGSRMRPITNYMPKPLVRVNEIPLIETIINALRVNGIEKIYIVVGYMQESLGYLKTKYSGISIIENPDYEICNNISSIYAARDIMGYSDCYICEADLFVNDTDIFAETPMKSCYLGKYIKGNTSDWCFYTNDERRITKITTGGKDLFNMAGISYWTQNDAALIRNAVVKAYNTVGNEQLYWDEIVDMLLTDMEVTIKEVNENQVIEIDTIEELQALDNSYLDLNQYLSKFKGV